MPSRSWLSEEGSQSIRCTGVSLCPPHVKRRPALFRSVIAMAWMIAATLVASVFDYYKFAEFHDGDRYTIHGSWPSRTDGSWPQYCSGPPFNATALLPLEPRLEKDWPNLWGSSLALHRHEYNRHGKCSGLSEVDFFARSLQAYERYSLNDLVLPSRVPPPFDRLELAFRQRYGVALELDRQRHGRAAEVSFCLNKAWKLIGCPT